MDKKPTMFQHIRAENDANGNPRRLWVFYRPDGIICKVIDEGYSGRPALCKGLVELAEINVGPKEYRSLRNYEDL